MTILRLAIRNLRGAGFRTLLNALALSFAFVAIIFGQGLLQGMNKQAEDASVAWEYSGGQFWQENYDPYDPLTLDEAHAPVPPEIGALVEQGRAVPILVIQGSIYPQGRLIPVLIKGIEPSQTALAIPTTALDAGHDRNPSGISDRVPSPHDDSDRVPRPDDDSGRVPSPDHDDSDRVPSPDDDFAVLLGARMARAAGLEVGDYVTVQWRDRQGAFDAREARVAHVFETSVTSVDMGQVWVPLAALQKLTGMEGSATLVVLQKGAGSALGHVPGWVFRSPAFLLSDLRDMVRSKTVGQSIMFGVLFLLAMLAIFDTQVLSVFRRRREIGMLIALGMTRAQVIAMFTLEGALYGVLAAIMGAVYGTPLFVYVGRNGITFPGADSWGFAIGETLYPAYTAGLVLGTTALVLVVTTIVSWLPTRKIARLRPTDALSGRMT